MSAKKIGLDEHQVRTWTSWYRHTTLAMLAYAILTAIAAAEADNHDPASGLIPLTVNEIRHLFSKLITNVVRPVGYWLAWSAWRRRHQAIARESHYRRQRHPQHPLTST